jgi:hypothetical protein
VTADTGLWLCRFFGLSNGWWPRAQAAHDTEAAEEAPAEELRRVKPRRQTAASWGPLSAADSPDSREGRESRQWLHHEVPVRALGPDDVGLMRALLGCFAEASCEPLTYCGELPGPDYLQREDGPKGAFTAHALPSP